MKNREVRSGWWRRLVPGTGAGLRLTGPPRSANGASSMHLVWELGPAGRHRLAGAAVTLTVLEPPRVPQLYFWALQASFGDRGGAHLGLQWCPGHPDDRAANFGGYDRWGRELGGSPARRPSARHNPNTRDFPWEVGRAYRLSIERAGRGSWAGCIDGEELRTLQCDGEALGGLMMWSEVFADCDAPPVTVRWSDLEVTAASGGTSRVPAVVARYQSESEGGCSTGTALADAQGAVLQRSGTERHLPAGTRLWLVEGT